MCVVTRVQHAHRDNLPWLILLIKDRIVYNAFLYLLKVQTYTRWLCLLLASVLGPCRSMATFARICSLATLSLNLLLMRWRCDTRLNFCLGSIWTDKLLCKLIGRGITSKDSLMKLGSIVSAFIIFCNYWSIVTIARFRPGVFSGCINRSLVQKVLQQSLLVKWSLIHILWSFIRRLLLGYWWIKIVWYKVLYNRGHWLCFLAWVVCIIRNYAQAFYGRTDISCIRWLITTYHSYWRIISPMVMLLNCVIVSWYNYRLILSAYSTVYLRTKIRSWLVLTNNGNVMRFLSAVATWGRCQLGWSTFVLCAWCLCII